MSLQSPSGIPAIPIYPHLLGWLKTQGMNDENLTRITHDANARTLMYNATPPGEATETGVFAGEASFDGLSQAIGGGTDVPMVPVELSGFEIE